MAEYIEREALLKDISESVVFSVKSGQPSAEMRGANKVIDRIKSAKTADVVEVVRCKDCKYWQDNNGGYPHEECRWDKDETPDDDDFCSYGERNDYCITCSDCKHLMFSDCYGECSKGHKGIVEPWDTCEYAERRRKGESE